MPQIAQLAETWSSQIFWLLVFFGITFFFIGRLMVPRVMETVALRDKQIGDDLAAAQAVSEAEQRIAASRDEAMGEIQTVAAEAAQDIVQRLAGIKVTKPTANKAVKEAMIHG